MPFPFRQHLPRCHSSVIYDVVERVGENGVVEAVRRDSSTPLPEVSLTNNLSRLIKAGANLQRVSSKVISGSSSFVLSEKTNPEKTNPDQTNPDQTK